MIMIFLLVSNFNIIYFTNIIEKYFKLKQNINIIYIFIEINI